MEKLEIDKFKLASDLLEVLESYCPFMEKLQNRTLKDVLIEKCLILAEDTLKEINIRKI